MGRFSRQGWAWALAMLPCAALAALDTTPPVLTAFDSAASVDVTRATHPLQVRFTATDDLAGVSFAGAKAYGPSGQTIEVSFKREAPAGQVNGVMLSSNLPAFLEPGTYTFKSAYVGDVNYNYRNYDEAALKALGRSTFTVKNGRGYDATPPALTSGKLLTPVVSLSDRAPGTDKLPFVSVSLQAADLGNTVVAGVRSASAIFCLPAGAPCIDAASYDDVAPHASSVKLLLGAQLAAYQTAGDYQLYQVRLGDYAGNSLLLTSQAFGGTTDFSAYFPSTTLTVTP